MNLESLYVHRPIEVLAVRITKEVRADNTNWPNWMNEAWNKPHDEVGALYPSEFPDSDGKDKLIIHTDTGTSVIEWGDFLIKGMCGHIYPCHPDLFTQLYSKCRNCLD